MSFTRSTAVKAERTASAQPLTTLLVLSCLLLLSGTLVLRGPFNDAFPLGSYLNANRTYGEPYCRPASAAVSVATSIINIFAQTVVIPAVQDESCMAVVPEYEEDHIWVDRMVLQHFRMGALTVKTATPNAQSMTASANSFGVQVNETRFRYTYMGISCYGHFIATLNDTDIDAVIGFTLLPENRWNATVTQLKFRWGTLAIYHKLDSKMCGIAQALIELFTGQLDKYIVEKVQRKLETDGRSKAAEVLNSLFAQVDVLALTPPVMTTDRLSVVLDATPASVGCPLQPPVTDLPPLLPRNIVAHTTVNDINNALYNIAVNDRLRWMYQLPDAINTSLFADVLPEVYEMCVECPMYTLVRSSSQPVVVFLPLNTVTLTLRDLVVGLYVVPRTAAERDAVGEVTANHNVPYREKFVEVSRRLGLVDDTAAEAGDGIAVLALSCSATFGVHNISFERGRAVRYNVLSVNDFAVDVVASLIGNVSAVEIEQKGMRIWNKVVVPIVNAKSPYKLPFFVREAELIMTLVNVDGGFNVGLRQGIASSLVLNVSERNARMLLLWNST
ncbi:putative expression site-associated protein 5 (ESAG5) [Leptomonas seymouri]|uniref:Putative expression site-associated protein 5 (ESAG5) n=1 Tax=Leptomonas seymouri TaxID=5684 RepID=A0A0N1I082_LEPSE|nr:putative expression site-associated protein 5 (ESAG5) [Leptomonas seymouri]|eukprot:KPI87974.1 putative expression site-associated protein 5 (ESAG5) [Leptomonas seymouri]